MEYRFKLISSLEKVFFDWPEQLPALTQGSMLKNEVYSFQMIGWTGGHGWPRVKCGLEIESELKDYITVRRVGYVPSTVPSMTSCDDGDYITKKPGLFPDPLYRLEEAGTLELADEQARAFWFVLEPCGRISGRYPITLKLSDPDGNPLETLTLTIDIIDAELPRQKLRNTGWFHLDCIALAHHVEPMSGEHLRLAEKYLEVYAAFGHNMILTPVFTPPLDTAVGGERPTIQLADVTVRDGSYTFGFDKLDWWISICKKYGIEYFEISHLFTQWGAKSAPKIMADVNGTTQRLFGWETDSLSEEYREFLAAFLPELSAFLRARGIWENCYFHVSDEPSAEHIGRYQKAKEILRAYVPDEQMIDALGNFEFYEKGIVKKPIVATDHVAPFLEHQVENLWVYYCTGQGKDVANRFMAMPSYRNRILGCQLYKYQIQGFLQWGFNFWFSQFSTHLINPFSDTDAGGGFQSGDPFIVYPVDEAGEVVCSLRLYVFHEALQDLRALELLEARAGREKVLSLLEQVEGFDRYPRSSEFLLSLRERVNRTIQELSR